MCWKQIQHHVWNAATCSEHGFMGPSPRAHGCWEMTAGQHHPYLTSVSSPVGVARISIYRPPWALPQKTFRDCTGNIEEIRINTLKLLHLFFFPQTPKYRNNKLEQIKLFFFCLKQTVECICVLLQKNICALKQCLDLLSRNNLEM